MTFHGQPQGRPIQFVVVEYKGLYAPSSWDAWRDALVGGVGSPAQLFAISHGPGWRTGCPVRLWASRPLLKTLDLSHRRLLDLVLDR